MDDERWRVTSSRHVLRDRWISVRADDCITPRGVTVAPFYVREEADGVAVLAFDTEDRLILVRQYRHGIGRACLELPGGMMDAGETDPVAVARRELEEETGYRGGTLRHLVALAVSPSNATNWAHLVLATGVEAGEAHPEPAEDITVERVTREEARKLALSGGIVNARHVGYVLLGLARLADEAEADRSPTGPAERS